MAILIFGSMHCLDMRIKKINNGDYWIIDDVRYSNEAQRIRDLNGVLIRVEKDLHQPNKHIAENSLDTWGDWDLIIENNFDEFSKAISKLQNIMGKYFNIFQNGMFSSSEVSNVLNFLRKENVSGYGQTSWGPTGFALFPNIKKAEEMRLKLKKRFSSCKNLEFIICSGKNSGADIQLL